MSDLAMRLLEQRVDKLERSIEARKRLEGVQGPEQGLVGESRSDEPTGHAEEAKPGERGVGETVERAELRRTVERMISEARTAKDAALHYGMELKVRRAEAKESVLVELHGELFGTAEERSGLSNAKNAADPAAQPQQNDEQS